MRALLLLVAVVGCTEAPGEEALPEGDYPAFAQHVQPVLSARCASPTCHGDPERPLSLYAPYQRRLDPARLHRDAVLEEEEVRRNYARVLGFLDTPYRCLLLLKPLAAAAGGAEHEGGVQFWETTDAEFRTLADWVADAMGEAP